MSGEGEGAPQFIEPPEITKKEADSDKSARKEPQTYVHRLDELRNQARELAQLVKGKDVRFQTLDQRNKIAQLEIDGLKVFEDYFNDSIATNAGKDIVAFTNPDLSWDEVEETHTAINKYCEIEETLPPPSNTTNAKLRAGLLRDQQLTADFISEKGVIELVGGRNYPASNFAEKLSPLLRYEFKQMGIPLSSSLPGLFVDRLPELRTKKDSAVINDFFGPDFVDRLDKDTYEEAMLHSTSNEKDQNGKELSKDAIEILSQYPNPDVVHRLLIINASDTTSLKQNVWGFSTSSTPIEGSALNSLLKIQDSTNWSDLVAKTIEKYPGLGPARGAILRPEIPHVELGYRETDTREVDTAVNIHYFIPIRLGIASPPEAPDLAQLIKSRSERISVEQLHTAQLLSDEEYEGLYCLPLAFQDLFQDQTLRLSDTMSSFEEKQVALARIREISRRGKLFEQYPIFTTGIGQNLIWTEKDLTTAILSEDMSIEDASKLAKIGVEYKTLHTSNPLKCQEFYDQFSDTDEFPVLMRYLIKQEPLAFMSLASKKDWIEFMGEERVNTFLNSLPLENDEKRNAFTHNKYDRTTQFLKDTQTFDIAFGPQYLDIAGAYISDYGMAKENLVFRYFTQLYKLQKGEIDSLPADMEQSNLRTTDDLKVAVERMQQLAYGQEPITDLSKLSDFDLALLNVVTGHARHRFTGVPFQRIVSEFKADMEVKAIEGVPEGYEPYTITLQKTKIEFDTTGIEDDFRILEGELYDALRAFDSIKPDLPIGQVQALLDQKIENLTAAGEKVSGPKRESLEKELAKFKSFSQVVSGIDSLDDLMRFLVTTNISKTGQNNILRRCVFQAYLEKHPQFRDELDDRFAGRDLQSPVEPDYVLQMIDLIKDPVLEHVMGREDLRKNYWSPDTLAAMKANKKVTGSMFNPYLNNLKNAADQARMSQEDSSLQIQAIPDRGFIGEMSAYLADVCYSTEYPLLKGRKVVPYKFVTTDDESGMQKFIGSVLVFEVENDTGEGELLVRGFDVPKESQYNISQFVEQFLDKTAEVGEKRNKTNVLVPGNLSTISNYTLTKNHIFDTYVKGKDRVSLKEQFKFNGYDLTHDTFVARTIPASDEV